MTHYRITSREFAEALLRQLGEEDPLITTDCTDATCLICQEQKREYAAEVQKVQHAITWLVRNNSMEF